MTNHLTVTPLVVVSYISVVLLAWISSASTTIESSLVQVQVISRHGLRAPNKPYPGDPYNKDQDWPQGWGGLTNATQEGKRQQYRLGQFLRSRYKTLAPVFKPSQVSILSSDSDRTIMSSLACLAGLFPPSDQEVWSTKVPNWQPIPLRTMPSSEDKTIKGSAPCPKYDALWKNLLETDQRIQDFNREYQDFYSYIGSHTNETYKYPVDLTTFLEALIIQEAHGMRLPEWTSQVYPSDRTNRLLGFAFELVSLTDEMKRLKGGPLLTELLGNIETFVRSDLQQGSFSKSKKMVLFSGHDITLARILATLQVFDPPHLPDFNSALMVELHKSTSETGCYFVKVFYRRGESEDLEELWLPNCTSPCSLEAFKETYSKFIISETEWTQECQNIEEDRTSTSFFHHFIHGIFNSFKMALLTFSSSFWNTLKSPQI